MPTLRNLIAALVCMTALPTFADDAMPGKAKAVVCAACHGADGNSSGPEFPKLAGQYEDYLNQALHAYQTGTRKNPIMAGQAASLSKQDIDDLAAYFASLPGQLHTKK